MNKKIVTLLLIVGGLFLGSMAAATDYCSMSVLGPSTTDYIARVLLTGDDSILDNTTTGSFNGPDYYELFSGGGVVVPTITEGQNYTISIQIGTHNLSSVAAWIDFNGDGTFSTSERLGQTAAVVSDGFATYSFTAPSSLSGMSRLRVLDLRMMFASLAYFGNSLPGCGAITVAQGEIEDYNINLIGTYVVPLVGGSPRRIIPVDFCPEGDSSMTQYDGLCAGMSVTDGVTATGTTDPISTVILIDLTPVISTGESTVDTGTEMREDTQPEITTGGVDTDTDMDRCEDTDMQTAFIYGSAHGLFDFQTCLLARMSDGLTRIDAAKILSTFAMNILDKKPNYDVTCPFSDMTSQDSDAQHYAIIACQLGLMGLKGDGTAAATFNPNGLLDKAQLATILSRLVYGNQYNTLDSCRYCKHVDALKANGIINVTTDLFMPLKRGRAMLMLMRIDN